MYCEGNKVKGVLKTISVYDDMIIIEKTLKIGPDKIVQIPVSEVESIKCLNPNFFNNGFLSICLNGIENNVETERDASKDKYSIVYNTVDKKNFNQLLEYITDTFDIPIISDGVMSSAKKQSIVQREERQYQDDRLKQLKKDHVAYCPKCKSTSLSAHKKGFGVGKAAVGVALTGGLIGAVGGNIGAKKVRVTCLNCGHQFWAGKK